MNEMMRIYLKLGGRTRFERRRIIQRMDSLLLGYGVKYGGVSNFYVPLVDRDRDDTFYTAQKVLEGCQWLKGILDRALVLDRTDVCPLEEIRVRHMADPAPEKYRYYEEYYFLTGKLPHPVLVDENRCLREGYVSYMLARRYGVKAQVKVVFAVQPCRKIVIGRHVSGAEFRRPRAGRYAWVYGLRDPVVPGDILRAETERGYAHICVEDIGYLTGIKYCAEHRSVLEHMHCRRDAPDGVPAMEEEGEHSADKE